MKHQVHITERALQDVDDVLSWFQQRQAMPAGERWYEQLMAKVDTLESNPLRCSFAAESDDLQLELRELLFGRRWGVYRIIFVVKRNSVHVLRIRHAMRDSLSSSDLQ